MLYLQKNEIISDLKKIIKESASHKDIVEMCREALGALEKAKDEPIKEFIKNNYVIAQCFIYTLERKKNCPVLVIDYIYTFLANSVLKASVLGEFTRILSTKSTWSEHEKMKILQMSFYLVRNDEFGENSTVDLLNYLFGLIDDQNKQISNTAKPITIQIIDYLFNKVANYGQWPSEEVDVKAQEESVDVEEHTKDHHNKSLSPLDNTVVDIDTFIETYKSRSPDITLASPFCERVYAKECINILQTIFNKRNDSKNLSLFYGDVIILIIQKCSMLEDHVMRKVSDFFTSFVFPDIKHKIQNGSKEEKERFVEFIEIVCKSHYATFVNEIDTLLGVIEEITTQKDFHYVLPLILNLDPHVMKGHEETILMNLLERYSFSSSTRDHSKVIYNLSESLKDNDKVYEKYATGLIQLFKDSKSSTEENIDLVSSVLEFSLMSENLEMFDTLVHIFKSIKMAKSLLVECIKNRHQMKNGWEIVFENIKEDFDTIVASLNLFNDEEVFYLVKSLTSSPTRWSLSETLLYYTTTFESISEILKNQDNVKIPEMFTSSLLSLLSTTENKENQFEVASRYCQIVVGYTSNLDKPALETEKTIVGMLMKILSFNVTDFGPLVLQTLQTLLRIFIPSDWEATFLIIEMCTIPSLHRDLFRVLSLIIVKYLDLIGTSQFLILFSCVEDICASSDDDLSDKAMTSMLEIGECIISNRIVKGSDHTTWSNYLSTLFQFTSDSRSNIRDKSIRHLFQFIFSDSVLAAPSELDFLFDNILIPLITSRTEALDTILTDQKSLDSLFVLFEELSRHDCLKFARVEYLEAQLGLIEGILSHEKTRLYTTSPHTPPPLHSGLVYKCIAPLSVRVHPPSTSIRLFAGDLKKQKIQFGGTSCNEEEIEEVLFRFYQKLFAGFEKYSPEVFILLLDELRRFDAKNVLKNIRMFDKALLSATKAEGCPERRRVTKKVIATLFNLESEEESVINYLLEFMACSETLAALILANSRGRLSGGESQKTINNYLKKISEVVEAYDSLWEMCLGQVLETSRFVGDAEVFGSFIEVSEKLFDKVLRRGDSVGCGDPNTLPSLQIYTNKQFSHYLEYEPEEEEAPRGEAKGTHLDLAISSTIESRRKERLLLNYLVTYYSTINRLMTENKIDSKEASNGFELLLRLTEIKNDNSFSFYNLSFKSYHLLFNKPSHVFKRLVKVLKKVLKNYNEEEKLNNMLFSSIKQKEIYLVFELLIESRDKKLIERLKMELLNCLKNRDFNVVEYVRRNLMILFEEYE